MFRTALIAGLGVGAYSMVGLTQRKLEKELERVCFISWTTSSALTYSHQRFALIFIAFEGKR